MRLGKWMIMIVVLLVAAIPARAQKAPANVDSLIRHLDGMFWKAYNSCDVPAMATFIADDVEFYHDKGGITLGKDALAASLKKGLCSNAAYHLRREAIAETVRVFPLAGNGQVYGALISGEHLFYITDKGNPEYLDGHARFTQMWLLRNGVWQMSRILSYDHQPAGYQNRRVEKRLPAGVLSRLAGAYQTKDKGQVLVRHKGNNLLLTVGGNTFTLFPESDHLYFIKEKDLTFSFDGKGGMEIKEQGRVVEKATRTR